jgi:hypothetical protein
MTQATLDYEQMWQMLKEYVIDGVLTHSHPKSSDSLMTTIEKAILQHFFSQLANKVSEIEQQAGTRVDLLDLIKEVREACEFRGHKMDDFRIKGDTTAFAECQICGKGVVCRTEPAPNQINNGGPAIAVDCEE